MALDGQPAPLPLQNSRARAPPVPAGHNHLSPLDRVSRRLRFQAGELDTRTFCGRFEQTYNLELDKETLSKIEADAFGMLFERVIWYSPFPEERRQIPNYVGEAEISAAVEEAARQLERDPMK